MQSRKQPFIFDVGYNFITDTPMIKQENETAFTNPSSEYLITQDSMPLITQDGNNLVANQ